MELVYLWVEKYKNIENQGFNFSPRFDCKYDKDSNELTIDKNENYISIFPENINVTAIVGENGSGKSSIAELLGEFNWQDFHKPNRNFLVFLHKNKFIFRCNVTGSDLYFNIQNKTNYENATTTNIRELFLSYFANELSTFLNKDLPLSYKTYENFDAMKDNSRQQIMDNNKLDIPRDKILEYELFNKRFQNILLDNKDLFYQINQKFIFNNKKREIHFYEIGVITAGKDNPINKLFKKYPSGNVLFSDNTFEDTPHQTYFYKYLILNRLIYTEIDKTIDFKKLIEDIKETFQKNVFEDKDYSYIINKIHEVNPIRDDEYNLKNVKELLEHFEYKNNNIWIEKNATDIYNNSPFINSLLDTINQYKTIRVNYFNDGSEDYSYLSLSSGEREYIKLLTHYIYHLKNNDRRDIFYFDEPDLALHPNWQKRLIKDFIYFAKKFINEKEIQLIITSHSPFILSDLPKENVIFLKEGKQEFPFKEDKQTFGANIHTLLSHGFFMEDGLIGEFAKGKIEEIIDFYKEIQKDNIDKEKRKLEYINDLQKKFWNIQSIIGDDYLQQVIKNHLVEIEKILLGIDKYKENEKKRLQAQIDLLDQE